MTSASVTSPTGPATLLPLAANADPIQPPTCRPSAHHLVRTTAGSTSRPGRRPVEPQLEPVSQVVDFMVHRRGHGLGERDVLMDRIHAEHYGAAVGGRVEFADE